VESLLMHVGFRVRKRRTPTVDAKGRVSRRRDRRSCDSASTIRREVFHRMWWLPTDAEHHTLTALASRADAAIDKISRCINTATKQENLTEHIQTPSVSEGHC